MFDEKVWYLADVMIDGRFSQKKTNELAQGIQDYIDQWLEEEEEARKEHGAKRKTEALGKWADLQPAKGQLTILLGRKHYK